MFRFSIRDVLWLMALAAMGAAWWVDHRMASVSRDKAFERLRMAETYLFVIEFALNREGDGVNVQELTDSSHHLPERSSSSRLACPASISDCTRAPA